MVGVCGGGGKIVAAVASDPACRSALEADLTIRGIDLDGLQVRQVAAAWRALVADPSSLLAGHLGGDGWSRTDHLLAVIADALHVANWQRSKDGKHAGRRPKPISPLAKSSSTTRFGWTDRSPAEVAAVLARVGPQGVNADV